MASFLNNCALIQRATGARETEKEWDVKGQRGSADSGWACEWIERLSGSRGHLFFEEEEKERAMTGLNCTSPASLGLCIMISLNPHRSVLFDPSWNAT